MDRTPRPARPLSGAEGPVTARAGGEPGGALAGLVLERPAPVRELDGQGGSLAESFLVQH